MKKIGSYTYEKSTRKDKKLMTKVDGKTIHFGNPKYEHFTLKTAQVFGHILTIKIKKGVRII
jgi:hypothetical protein